MADELTLAVGGSTGLISIIGGWFLRTFNKRIEAIEAKSDETYKSGTGLALQLAEYKLEAQKEFAKDSDVKALGMELKASVQRVHDRLDQTATSVEVNKLTDRINSFLEKQK